MKLNTKTGEYIHIDYMQSGSYWLNTKQQAFLNVTRREVLLKG